METPSGIVLRTSSKPYEAAVSDARRALESKGQTIFAQIDQAAAAESSGTTLRPTTLFVFGNPKAGTPLMDTYPLVALELPLKILIWRGDDGKTQIAYRTAASLREAYGMDAQAARLSQIDAALSAIADAIVS